MAKKRKPQHPKMRWSPVPGFVSPLPALIREGLVDRRTVMQELDESLMGAVLWVEQYFEQTDPYQYAVSEFPDGPPTAEQIADAIEQAALSSVRSALTWHVAAGLAIRTVPAPTMPPAPSILWGDPDEVGLTALRSVKSVPHVAAALSIPSARRLQKGRQLADAIAPPTTTFGKERLQRLTRAGWRPSRRTGAIYAVEWLTGIGADTIFNAMRADDKRPRSRLREVV